MFRFIKEESPVSSMGMIFIKEEYFASFTRDSVLDVLDPLRKILLLPPWG